MKGNTATLAPNSVNFVQTEDLIKDGIAVQKYGAIVIPSTKSATPITIEVGLDGTTYKGTTSITSASAVGDTVILNKDDELCT